MKISTNKLLLIAFLLVCLVFIFNAKTSTYFSVADMSNRGSLDSEYNRSKIGARVSDYFNLYSPSEFGVRKQYK